MLVAADVVVDIARETVLRALCLLAEHLFFVLAPGALGVEPGRRGLCGEPLLLGLGRSESGLLDVGEEGRLRLGLRLRPEDRLRLGLRLESLRSGLEAVEAWRGIGKAGVDGSNDGLLDVDERVGGPRRRLRRDGHGIQKTEIGVGEGALRGCRWREASRGLPEFEAGRGRWGVRLKGGRRREASRRASELSNFFNIN